MNKTFILKPNFQLLSISSFIVYIVISLLSSSSYTQSLAQLPQPAYYPNPIGAAFARLDNWRFSPEVMQLEFAVSAGIKPQYFYLAEPPRIVIDLPNTKLGYVPTQQNYSGTIQRVRVSQFNAEITRIVLDLAPGNFLDSNQFNLQPISQNNLTRWVLRPVNTGARNPVQPAIYPPSPSRIPVNPQYPQQPSNLPQLPNNYPQPPISPINQPTTANQQLPFFTLPPPSTNLPTIPTNQQQPFVVVPPLQPHNQSQLPGSNLTPPTFSNQPAKNNPAGIANPNFPMPTIPQYPANELETMVIEFGQPIPKMRN